MSARPDTDTTDHSPRQEDYPDGQDPRRWRALAVTLAAGFMTLLDVSIVNVALPSIQSGLHASPQGVQWVVSGYALAFGLALVAGGRLGDVVGRRRLFLIGLSAFVLTSAASGAAPTEALLISARLLQGLASGLLIPQNAGLIQDLFRGPERGRAFGLLGSTIGLSTAAGPVIGGLILAGFGDQTGWRWIFYVNVPVGFVALALTLKVVPAGRRMAGTVRSQIDFAGMGLLGLAVVGIMLPVVRSEGGGDALQWLLLVPGGLFAVLFVRWESRLISRDGLPLLDLRLFTQAPGFARGLTVGSTYFCGFSGIWLVLSLFTQNGLHYTPLQSGLTVTPFAVGSAVSAVFAGRLVDRWGRWLTVGGLALVALSLAVVALLIYVVGGPHIGFVTIAPLLIGGIGGGAVVAPNTTLTLSHVPTRMAGAAGGALQTGQRVGTAVGTAVLATVLRLAVGDKAAYHAATALSLTCAIVFMVIALVMAVLDLRSERAGTGGRVGEQALG